MPKTDAAANARKRTPPVSPICKEGNSNREHAYLAHKHRTAQFVLLSAIEAVMGASTGTEGPVMPSTSSGSF